MHTIKQIIENQSQYRDEIVAFLKNELAESLKMLREMSTSDTEVSDQVDIMRKRVKKMKTPSIASLFFLSKKRDLNHYAWWDAENEEVIIHGYAKNR